MKTQIRMKKLLTVGLIALASCGTQKRIEYHHQQAIAAQYEDSIQNMIYIVSVLQPHKYETGVSGLITNESAELEVMGFALGKMSVYIDLKTKAEDSARTIAKKIKIKK